MAGEIKVTNDSGNIIFDSSMKGCKYQLCESQGETFAFVQALDIGYSHARLKKPQRVRYWGKFDRNQKAASIIEILHTGGEWPDLSEE